MGVFFNFICKIFYICYIIFSDSVGTISRLHNCRRVIFIVQDKHPLSRVFLYQYAIRGVLTGLLSLYIIEVYNVAQCRLSVYVRLNIGTPLGTP